MLNLPLILLFAFPTPADDAAVVDFAASSAVAIAQDPIEEPVSEEQEPEEGVEEEEVIEEVLEEDVIEEEVLEEETELTPEEAVELLETALKTRELDLIYAAIEETGRVDDKKLVKLLGKAVKHKDSMVRMDALEALRFNKNPEALKELLKLKKYKPILEDEVAAEAYYLSLGQKGDVKALAVLTDKLHVTSRGDKSNRARILAIGHIRDKKSVEALLGMLTSGGGRRRHPNIKEIHLSLTVLTGAEVKSSTDAWLAWWNDNKKTFKVTKEEQEATTKKGRATWKTIWADPEDAEMMKEALKRGKTDFADADEDELDRLREKAEKRKKKEEEDEKEDGKDDGEEF